MSEDLREKIRLTVQSISQETLFNMLLDRIEAVEGRLGSPPNLFDVVHPLKYQEWNTQKLVTAEREAHALTRLARDRWLWEAERLRKELDAAKTQVAYFESSRTYLELTADKERLDWWQSWIDRELGTDTTVEWDRGEIDCSMHTLRVKPVRLREAIDAARKGGEA